MGRSGDDYGVGKQLTYLWTNNKKQQPKVEIRKNNSKKLGIQPRSIISKNTKKA
jgi:hypothetical protein